MIRWGTKTFETHVTRKSSLFHKTPWMAQLIFSLQLSAPSLEPIYSLTEARLVGPPELSSGTYLPSEERNSKLQAVELRVAASINRYLEEDSYYGKEQGLDWRNREKINAEKRDIERHLAPKYSYDHLFSFIAINILLEGMRN